MSREKDFDRDNELEELGGWLSSVLMDDVPASDRITTSEKIKVVEKKEHTNLSFYSENYSVKK